MFEAFHLFGFACASKLTYLCSKLSITECVVLVMQMTVLTLYVFLYGKAYLVSPCPLHMSFVLLACIDPSFYRVYMTLSSVGI